MASPYPVIISAEVHCGPQQQLALACILKEVFGSALVTAPIAINQGLREHDLPSPEQLKYKILFKRRLSRVGEGLSGKRLLALRPSIPMEAKSGKIQDSLRSEKALNLGERQA
ncbi:hypothetical protein QFC22_000208 [Naganishia vaughanmartiniae]|uniref:Uncharacterized protein n=1 Tax=Naganishia vaughanmartiniae TaxID=1424756 RepID=A0ACC2XNP8_9TREE|nr:hypothetical protein QFC22_000208 [Naganishia vaughanmartiniae]